MRTHRWDSLLLAVLWLAALGVFFRSKLLLSLTAVPITFVAYGAIAREPPTSVTFERTLEPESPLPGQDVTVTLSVTNTGGQTVSDLRVIDGLPSELGVATGSARTGFLVRPGATESLEYAVTARRGEHEFRPVQLVAYTASGSVAYRESRAVETTLECRRPVDELPIGDRTSLLAGRLATDTGGSGVEFHSLRDYRTSDARSRIDWRRFAKSGDLSTVVYRQHRSASVHLLLDTRPAAFRSAHPRDPTAVEYAAYAAELCFHALLADNHRVGIGLYPTAPTELAIGAGSQHEIDARRILTAHDRLEPPAAASESQPGGVAMTATGIDPDLPSLDGPVPAADGESVRELRGALPADAQILGFAPLLDEGFEGVLNALEAHGHPVRLISPDVTCTDTPGEGLAAHHRQFRIRRLRERSVPVIDWQPDEPLSSALGPVV